MTGDFNIGFVEVMHRAYKSGYSRMQDEFNILDHEQNMISAMAGILYWLQKEYRIYLVINPIPNVSPLKFAAVVYVAFGDSVKSQYLHQNPPIYYDWVVAHVEGLKVCLDLVEQKKQQQNAEIKKEKRD